MSITHVKNENFEKEVKNAGIPVLIDFWAPWCGPCQMMGPVFEELSNEYEGKLKFVKVNTEEERQLPGKYSVMGIPSLVLTKDGEEVDRIVGFLPKNALKMKIDELLAKT
ncbi:MAG: thioredoxin [Nanoarchaeota archaeon]|nr:thioredoxin [Nanoarchaeota archaeon]MBU1030149.1 thioredoxin [Nanoarchaeota archaeon]MBU1850425.1 thioredoxin [Nanoarchaeota archaeon]